jgi:hypothetical protein
MCALMQLVAHGDRNRDIEIKNIMSLGIEEYEMTIKNIKDEDGNENGYEYEYELGGLAERYDFFGLIIKLYDKGEDENFDKIDIETAISKITLDIYSYSRINQYSIKSEQRYIGSIPLIICKIKYFSNSILIKFPKKFFFTNSNFFIGHNNYYNFVIKSDIKFKSILIQNFLMFNDSLQRQIMILLHSTFVEFPYKYAIKTINPFIKSNCNCNCNNNTISLEKKITDSIENIHKIYFVIPIELTTLLKNIEIKAESNINLIELENLYKIEEKCFICLYEYNFVSDIRTNNMIIRFNFANLNELNLNYNDFDEYIQSHSNNISIFPIISNKLVSINSINTLKYSNGILNTTFTENEITLINTYSDNTDLLIKDILIKYIGQYQTKYQMEYKKDYDSIFYCIDKCLNLCWDF